MQYTKIQKIAIPIIKQNKNCIIVAPTGHGKTEAAILPIIDRICKISEKGIKLIYITPLRALNRDMIKRLQLLCDHASLTVGVRHGDTPQGERKRQSISPPDVIVTTPETLQSMLINPAFKKAFSALSAVVVDEIHELYHAKRGAQLCVALERLSEIKPNYQRVGISATVANPNLLGAYLCGKRDFEVANFGLKREIDLLVKMPRQYSSKVLEFVDAFKLDDMALARLECIANLVSNSNRTLIFGNTRQVVELVGSRLVYMNNAMKFGGIGVHHSSLDRNERIRIEEGFRDGSIRAIIATSSLELGIDIGAIDLVVQYASPRQALRLAQRVGRSGHKIDAMPKGVIVSLNPIDAIESIAVCAEVVDGSYETLKPHYKAQDILANQICGIALDSGGINIENIYSIVKRSLIYADLTTQELKSLLDFMAAQRMVGFDGNIVTPGARTRMYYYGHLSVITDVKKFIVKNFIDNRIISLLDERFVASSIEEGSIFITKGLPWRVVSIDDEVVFVEPSTDLEASVPDWEGEDIPVSFNIAQRAMKIIAHGLDEHNKFLDPQSKVIVNNFIIESKKDYAISLKNRVIESFDDYVVIYTWLGSSANDTLAKFISYNMSSRFNRSITTKTTPYMLLIESAPLDLVLKIINVASKQALIKDLLAYLAQTEIFRYRFIAAAKVFGIIDRDAGISKNMAKKLMQIMQATPLYQEATREVMENYFDIHRASEFLESIADKEIDIIVQRLDSPSKLTREIINYSYSAKELITPLAPNSEVIKSFTDSILKKETKLLCTYCGFVFSRSLKEIGEQEEIKCQLCKSPLISIYKEEFVEVINKKKRGRRLTKNEGEQYSEMVKYSNLISGYGPKAIIALSVYGIGFTTASRALMMRRRDEKSFFVDLIEAQKTFIKNKKYWS